MYEYINFEEGWLDALGIINKNFTGENTVEATEGYDYIVRKDKVTEDGKYYLDPSNILRLYRALTPPCTRRLWLTVRGE